MKFRAKGTWQAVAMPHTMFVNDAAMCGGIEVLNDYEINKPAKRKIESNNAEAVQAKKVRKNTFAEVDIVAKPAAAVLKAKKEPVKNVQLDKVKPAKPAQQPDKAKPVKPKQQQSDKTKPAKKDKKRRKDKNKQAINLDVLAKFGSKSTTPCAPPPTEVVEAAQEPKVGHKTKAKKANKKQKELNMDQWREVFVCEEIIQNLALKGFQAPTLIQKMTLPAAIKG